MHQGGPAWYFSPGLLFFGMGEEIPDWLDIEHQTRTFRAEWVGHADAIDPAALVPFFQDINDADRVCFDQSHRVVSRAHDAAPEHLDSIFSLILDRIAALCECKQIMNEWDRKPATLPWT